MVGIQAVHRGLRSEQDQVNADFRANHRALWDQAAGGDGAETADGMDVLSGRDVTIHYHYPEPKPANTPPALPENKSPSPAWSLAKMGLLALAATTPVGAGIAAAPMVAEWFKKPEAKVSDIFRDLRIEVGKPENLVEEPE